MDEMVRWLCAQEALVGTHLGCLAQGGSVNFKNKTARAINYTFCVLEYIIRVLFASLKRTLKKKTRAPPCVAHPRPGCAPAVGGEAAARAGPRPHAAAVRQRLLRSRARAVRARVPRPVQPEPRALLLATRTHLTRWVKCRVSDIHVVALALDTRQIAR